MNDISVTPVPSDATQISTLKIQPDTTKKNVADWVRDMRMSSEVNKTTVGVETERVTPELLMATSKKLLGISRREQQDDPKDSLLFQRFYGPAEYFAEHILRDSGKLGRNLLWKATNRGNLDFMQTGVLDQHVSDVFYDSKLAQMIDASSPLETVDASYKTTRIGEGGIGDADSAPDEMRTVQPSFFGFIDGVRSPESFRVGLDTYMSKNCMKGSDGKLYQKFINARTGKEELVDSATAAKSVVASNEMMEAQTKSVFALGGPTGVRIVNKKDIDYYLPRADEAYSMAANMVPMLNSVKEMRLLMGCLHPDTSVLSVSNKNEVTIKKAKQVTGENSSIPGCDEKGVSVLYPYRNTIAKFPQKKRWFRKVVLKSGRVLITSCDHKWVVLSEDKHELCRADQLKPGDTVLRSSFKDIPARRTFINGVQVTKDVAVLLGCAVRSMVITDSGKLRISFEQSQRAALDSALTRLKVSHMYYTYEGRICLGIKDEEFIEWLKENVGGTDETRQVPSVILSAFAPIVAAFIDAFTEDATQVGIDSNEDIWLLHLPNPLVRDGLAFLLARISTDTLYRDSLGTGKSELALKLVAGQKMHGDMYIDTVKCVLEAPQAPIMVDIDINDNVYATANGIITHNSKYPLQAISLVNREAPLVRGLDEATGKDMHSLIGKYLGAKFAKQGGSVTAVRRDRIDVVYDDGTKGSIALYNNFPMNTKGYITNTPMVKAGQSFKKGDCVAASNYTDPKGTAAIGTNLRCGWISWKGATYEDALCISESAAKKLTSTTMYRTAVDLDKTISLGKKNYITWKPAEYNEAQMEKLDDNGVVKPGTVLKKGDPMILAVQTAEPSPGTMGKRILTDLSETWEHDHEGVVTDVVKTRKGVKVFATVTAPAEVGDKFSACYGNKGVISQILPDDQMPIAEDGKPLEMLFSPLSLVSRTNPGMVHETLLGKVARKTGKPEVIPAFYKGDLSKYIADRLKQANLKASEDLIDNETGRKIPGVLVGVSHIFKLKHLADSKMSARGTSEYTSDEVPAGSGYDGSKRFGMLEQSAMVGHKAFDNIIDAKILRGQSNADFWRSIRTGSIPTIPGEPLVHKKFFAHLIGSGVNVRKTGKGISAFTLSSDDVRELAGPRELKSRDTYEAKTFRPIDGGLFGQDVFGINGDKWGYIQLDEPLPNPVMEEPLSRLLRMSTKDFIAVASGSAEIDGMKNSADLRERLSKVNLESESKQALKEFKESPVSKKDNALKRYVDIERMRRAGVSPDKYMLDRIPVIPPQFRPVSSHRGLTMVADSNYLYAQMLDARDDARDAKDLPSEYQQKARETLYRNWKELTGLYEPENAQLKNKHVQGLLKWALGDSPKCHDDATDILTETGWVPFKDYTGNVKVATVNPYTDNLEWQMPTDVIHDAGPSEMIRIQTRVLDSLVTPNHEHYVAIRRRHDGVVAFDPFAKVRADYLVEHPNRMKVKTAASGYAGNMPVPPVPVKDLHAFAEFVGWYIADGWLHSNGSSAIIEVKEGGKKDTQLQALFDRLGCEYKRMVIAHKKSVLASETRSVCDIPAGYKTVRYAIYSWELRGWLMDHIGKGAPNKTVSKDILEWNSEYLEALLRGLLKGDGSKRGRVLKDAAHKTTWKNSKEIGREAMSVTTTSRALVDALQEIGAKTGIQLAVISAPDERDRIRALYRVSVRAFDYAMAEGGKQIRKEAYSGMVHCVTVPNGLIVTRRNGRVLVSGNSSAFQRKVLGATVDTVGRGVIVPNPRLKLNQLGVPIDMAFDMMAPMVARKMVKAGYTPVEALKQIKKRTPGALERLKEVIKDHPVLLNRAPTLHKLNIVALDPVLVNGKAIHTHPSIVPMMAGDYDGDALNVHTPVSDAARKEARERMFPEKNLIAMKNRKIAYKPEKEYMQGLYIATRMKKGDNVRTRYFSNIEEAKEAYRKGAIDVDDPIVITGK